MSIRQGCQQQQGVVTWHNHEASKKDLPRLIIPKSLFRGSMVNGRCEDKDMFAKQHNTGHDMAQSIELMESDSEWMTFLNLGSLKPQHDSFCSAPMSPGALHAGCSAGHMGSMDNATWLNIWKSWGDRKNGTRINPLRGCVDNATVPSPFLTSLSNGS